MLESAIGLQRVYHNVFRCCSFTDGNKTVHFYTFYFKIKITFIFFSLFSFHCIEANVSLMTGTFGTLYQAQYWQFYICRPFETDQYKAKAFKI